MKLAQKTEINENIITVDLSVDELGDATRDSATEFNQLHNFVRTIEYSEIRFTSEMKIVNGIPVITTEDADGIIVEEVSITDLVNKKYTIDENLHITFSIDITKIPKSDLGTVFDTPEKLGQAKATLFLEKIKETISNKLAEIRSLANNFEAETTVIL